MIISPRAYAVKAPTQGHKAEGMSVRAAPTGVASLGHLIT